MDMNLVFTLRKDHKGIEEKVLRRAWCSPGPPKVGLGPPARADWLRYLTLNQKDW